uniref:MmgE/PrpD family protein n=1 Tax=Cupriavidus necator TaxID=106590 RepID=UPI003F492A8B
MLVATTQFGHRFTGSEPENTSERRRGFLLGALPTAAAIGLIGAGGLARGAPAAPRADGGPAPLAQRLAEYVHALSEADIDAATLEALKLRLVDTFGCALAALDEPVIAKCFGLADASGPAEAALIGTRRRSSAELAAFANGAAIRYYDLNDGYLSKEAGHPSDHLSVCLAVAQSERRSITDFIVSAIAAYEIECRLFDAASISAKENWKPLVQFCLSIRRLWPEVLRERGGATVQNAHFLGKRIDEIDSQLDKLVRARSERLSRPEPSQLMQSIDAERRRLGELVSSLRQTREEAEMLVRNKGRLASVVASIRDDIDRVSKVIFTHEQLKLFSSDTCPYCLNAVSRTQGHCVCGNPVDENDYQRFFVSAQRTRLDRGNIEGRDRVHLNFAWTHGHDGRGRGSPGCSAAGATPAT